MSPPVPTGLSSVTAVPTIVTPKPVRYEAPFTITKLGAEEAVNDRFESSTVPVIVIAAIEAEPVAVMVMSFLPLV